MSRVARSPTSALAPIVGVLEAVDVAVDRLLSSVDLPARVTAQPPALVPATNGIHGVFSVVAVPRVLPATPIPPLPSADLPTDVVDDRVASAPTHDIVGSIRQAVQTLSYGDEYPSVAQTAQFVGMSTRTLQRRLAAGGVSHGQLVAECRFKTAATVLEQSSGKILDLALDLGYSDHANFTRAFRRWAGCSPREYRARCARRRTVGSRAA
jgi:AraC-like DNA-binding protein